MSRATVAWEGRPTLDNRIIDFEALKPKSDRLPIYYSFSYTTILGHAIEFNRFLNPETGFGEISFEFSFLENWEQKIRELRLTPKIAMSVITNSYTPYDDPGKAVLGNDVIHSGEITCVSFDIGLDAWGEAVVW